LLDPGDITLRVARILDVTPAGVFDLDRLGAVAGVDQEQHMGDAMIDILRITAAVLLGQGWYVVLHVDDEQTASPLRYLQRVAIAIGDRQQLSEVDAKGTARRPELIVIAIFQRMIDWPLQGEGKVTVGLHHQGEYRITVCNRGRRSKRGTDQVAVVIELLGDLVVERLTARRQPLGVQQLGCATLLHQAEITGAIGAEGNQREQTGRSRRSTDHQCLAGTIRVAQMGIGEFVLMYRTAYRCRRLDRPGSLDIDVVVVVVAIDCAIDIFPVLVSGGVVVLYMGLACGIERRVIEQHISATTAGKWLTISHSLPLSIDPMERERSAVRYIIRGTIGDDEEPH